MKIRKSKAKKGLEMPVLDATGKKVSDITLNGKTFDGTINTPLIHQVVSMYNANARSGTASTKKRSEVSGGGKKPWRQKGTGRARTGSIRNPLWRGGGIIHGPKPRDFSYSLPKKIKRSAIKSALNEKFMNNRLIVINNIGLKSPKTKEFVGILKSLNVKKNEGVLVVLDKLDKKTKLASRNIPKLSIKTSGNFNAYDILAHRHLIVKESELKRLEKRV